MLTKAEEQRRNDTEAMDINSMSNFDNIAQTLMNPIGASIAIVQFIGSLLYGIIRTSCINGELIFRRNFGIRYFDLYLYFGGVMWFWAFATGFINFPKWMGWETQSLVSNTIIFSLFGVVFFSLMFYHMIIKRFMRLNFAFYTKYDGDILPFLYKLPFALDSNGNPKEYFVRQIYEPLFIALIGLIFMLFINPQTGSFFVITAFGFAVKEMVRQQKVRNMILDQVDADIISKNMKGALKGESPKTTQGVYIAGLPNEGVLKDRFIASIQNKGEVFTAQ